MNANATASEREEVRFTLDDVMRPADRRSALRRVPRLALDALRIVRRATPRQMSAMVVLQLASGGGVVAQLLVAREVLTQLVAVGQGGSVRALWAPVAVFAGVSLAMTLLTAAAGLQQRLLFELVARHALDRVVAVGSSVEHRLLETPNFYNQLQRAQTSGSARIAGMVSSLTQLVNAVLTSGGIAVVLAILSPLLLAFVVVAAIPALVAAIVNSRESYAFEYGMTPESRERAYLINLMTSRSASKELRLFALGSHLRGRYRKLTDERLRQLRRFLVRRLRVALVGGFASSLGLAVALVALVLLLDAGRIGIADALTAGIAMQQLAGRLTAITASVAQLIEAGLFIDDYQAFLELAPEQIASMTEPDGDGAPASTAEPTGRRRFDGVRLEHVSFSYPRSSAPALQRVSLKVGAGEVVALVGGNGSGKTTLVKLICQLYRPTGGRVLWNEVDATTLAPKEITDDITVLFQDYIGYHLSALDNIVFGRIERGSDMDAAAAAARSAGAHDFLAALPQGYATRMGLEFKGGHELSIGEWQRVALARAFYRGGSLLILDEPTASLDPRAEANLFEQIRELSVGRSVLLISHRFSSARSADRIYVLDRGRIIEHGTHDELMRRGGHYAELFDLQAAAYLGERGG